MQQARGTGGTPGPPAGQDGGAPRGGHAAAPEAAAARPFRRAGAMAILPAGPRLSPLSAMAGDQGGSRDKTPDTSAYTNYSSTPEGVATPCDTCYMGAGLAGTQDKAPAAVPQTPRCDSCTK